MELSLKASAISCPWALFRFFARSFGDSLNTSCHANCCPKNWILYPYFRWWKKLLPFLGFWPIIRPLSPSSPCQAIHSDYYTDLLCPSSLSTRVRLWSTDSLTYILISSFNGQPLGPVNSNTEGWVKFLLSLLSVVDHVTIYIYIYIYIYISLYIYLIARKLVCNHRFHAVL